MFCNVTLRHVRATIVAKMEKQYYIFLHTYPPMKMEQTECSEKLACKIQTPGNYPEESIQKYHIVGVCICSFRYPACSAHASRCHLCPVRLYNIFTHYLTKGKKIRKKKLSNIKRVLIFSTNLSESFLILRRTE